MWFPSKEKVLGRDRFRHSPFVDPGQKHSLSILSFLFFSHTGFIQAPGGEECYFDSSSMMPAHLYASRIYKSVSDPI
ncbi:hypothetical protein CH371_19200 [Leptospira wolffii]|uniref:Uncharacterized protein n=1 Tax=Leptospira wolffii TaxID=409998 RepID=A0A2M9Z734_9LEPT|nr:hypothetical protein CH371_19200 [Leptospira wolffii]